MFHQVHFGGQSINADGGFDVEFAAAVLVILAADAVLQASSKSNGNYAEYYDCRKARKQKHSEY